MKKTLALVVALVMVFAAVASFGASAEDGYLNREFTIYEIDTAPTIDGVIEDGEYHLVSFWPADIEMKSVGDYVDNIEAYLYMCYDENNLYYAVKTECDAPHVAMMDNSSNHFIFNAHHVMTLIVPDDPTKADYPYEADKCDWSSLYNGNYGFEWSMIFSSEEVAGAHGANESFATAHFIGVPSTNYKCGSADGWDCYEMAIPWSALKNNYNPNGLTGAKGEVFGFDFNIGLSNINDDADVIANGGYDGGTFGYKGNYLKFAGCYGSESGAKEIGHCAVMTLGGEYVPEIDPVIPDESSEEPSVEPSEEPSKEESKPAPTPKTGDNGMIALAIVSVITLAGVVAVKKSK